MCEDVKIQDHHLNDDQRRYVYGVMFHRLRKLKLKALARLKSDECEMAPGCPHPAPRGRIFPDEEATA